MAAVEAAPPRPQALLSIAAGGMAQQERATACLEGSGAHDVSSTRESEQKRSSVFHSMDENSASRSL